MSYDAEVVGAAAGPVFKAATNGLLSVASPQMPWNKIKRGDKCIEDALHMLYKYSGIISEEQKELLQQEHLKYVCPSYANP